MNPLVLEEMTVEECLDRVGSEGLGRLAIVDDDGPLILPTNYSYEGGVLHIRTGEGAKLDAADRAGLAAFQIDHLDTDGTGSWSVLLRGRLRRLIAAEGGNEPTPLASGHRLQLIGLVPTSITGRYLDTEATRGGTPL